MKQLQWKAETTSSWDSESFTSEEVDPTTIFTKSNESTFHTNLQSLSLSCCLPSISLAQGHVGPVFLPKCFLLLTPRLSELSERWLEAIRREPIRSVCLDSDGELDAVKMRPASHLKDVSSPRPSERNDSAEILWSILLSVGIDQSVSDPSYRRDVTLTDPISTSWHHQNVTAASRLNNELLIEFNKICSRLNSKVAADGAGHQFGVRLVVWVPPVHMSKALKRTSERVCVCEWQKLNVTVRKGSFQNFSPVKIRRLLILELQLFSLDSPEPMGPFQTTVSAHRRPRVLQAGCLAAARWRRSVGLFWFRPPLFRHHRPVSPELFVFPTSSQRAPPFLKLLPLVLCSCLASTVGHAAAPHLLDVLLCRHWWVEP